MQGERTAGYPVARSGHQHRPCRPCRLSPVRPPCQWRLHPINAKRSDPQSEPSQAANATARPGQPKARTFLARSAFLAVLARRADGASLAIGTRSAVLARSTVHTIHPMNARCTIQAVFPRRAVSTCASNRGKCEAPQSEDAQSRLCVAPKAGIVHNGTIMCERAWRSMRDRQGKLTILARLALSAGLARRTCISDRNELTPDERALGIYSPSPS